MIGSSLFAIGTAPGFASLRSADAANLLCFAGSWFFTTAALIQLLLARPSPTRSWATPSVKAEYLSAAIQFFGTLNFNLSTGAAVWARREFVREYFAWWPNAAGSVAFLVSASLGVAAATLTVGLIRPESRLWRAAWTGTLGSIAFGVSAIGAYVTATGTEHNPTLAQLGTFAGALCFWTAAFLRRPKNSQ